MSTIKIQALQRELGGSDPVHHDSRRRRRPRDHGLRADRPQAGRGSHRLRHLPSVRGISGLFDFIVIQRIPCFIVASWVRQL